MNRPLIDEDFNIDGQQLFENLYFVKNEGRKSKIFSQLIICFQIAYHH